MKRMLINATQPEEIRLAMVDGQKLLNFEIEQFGREQRKGNIYKAVITRIEPSLEACFVDYGEERQGFLPFKEISRQYFATSDAPISQIRIGDALKVGQELMVQVEKEERGNKNAALTTFISLAGRYLVLMPNKPRSGGVSRRIEGNERQELRDAMNELSHPRGMSLIARTAGIGRAVNELRWDLDYLLGLWKAISDAADANKGAFLIYNESALVIRAIRDYYTSDVSEVLIDTDRFYDQAQQFMAHIMPDDAKKVKFYQDETALFARFQIEKQIESAYAREVKLPSGGSIVLDHTEALVAVDVNSAKSTKGGDIEETATNTNLEAADEIARQLRLRDLGGLIVIDFIDMEDQKNRTDVENRLRQALKQDRARVQFSTISRFGLLELSRQRLRPALFEGASISCPRCNGTGHVRDTESTSLQILRHIQEEAEKENTAAIQVQVPVDVTSYLLNKKREEITKIEIHNNINIVLIPNKQLETPKYTLERLKTDDPLLEALQTTYTLGDRVEDSDAVISKAQQKTNRQEPVIKNYLPGAAPAPQPEAEKRVKVQQAAPAKKEKPASGGFWSWLKGLLGSESTEDKKPAQDKRNQRNTDSKSATEGQEERRSNDRRRGGRSGGGTRDERNERNKGANGRGSDRNADRNNERTNDRANDRSSNRNNERGNAKADQTEQAERPERRRGTRNADTRTNDNTREHEQKDQRERTQRNGRRNNQADNAEATEKAAAPTRRAPRREQQPRDENRSNRVDEIENVAQQVAHEVDQNVEQQEQNTRSRNNRRERHPRQRNANVTQEETVQNTTAQPEDAGQDAQEDQQASTRSRRTRDRYGRDRRQRNVREETGDRPFVENADAQPERAQPVEQVQKPYAQEERRNTVQSSYANTDAAQAPQKGQEQKLEAQKTQDQQPARDTRYAAPEKRAEVAPPQASLAFVDTQHDTTIQVQKTTAKVDYTLPKEDLVSIAQQVGLEWVGTNTQRAKEVQEAIRNEPKVTLGREIKPSATVKDEPLVMVETQKTLTHVYKPSDEHN